MKNIKDITNAFYINLESRKDRKEYVEEQLKLIGINQVTRFNAIKLENGAVGCSMSHLKCIETAKKNNWDHVLIVEDDITFLNPMLFINNLNKFLERHDDWDVVLIGGNVIPPYKKVDFSCVQVINCQTTTGYLVKSNYYDTLIKNYKEGIQSLLREPDNKKMYAIDRYWFPLQEKDKWFLIIPLTVTQKYDYSDIEKQNTNYTRMLTDLDKPWLTNPLLKNPLLKKVEQNEEQNEEQTMIETEEKTIIETEEQKTIQIEEKTVIQIEEQKTMIETEEQKTIQIEEQKTVFKNKPLKKVMLTQSPVKMMINNKTNTKINMVL